MSALGRSSGFRPPSDALDVPDLDVTPIMNMFVILVPFLISMAVFTHLSVIEFSLPPNVGAGLNPAAGKPKVKMTVVVTADRIQVTHGERMLEEIPFVDGNVDVKDLAERIAGHRTGITVQDETVVAVRNKIKFKYVVKVMDSCRAAGFTKIGLSSATENPDKGV